MMMNNLARIRERTKKYLTENGSYTLETTLIFPLIFIFLLLLLSLSLIQYQLAWQFYETTTIADKTAHNWEVIDRIFITGEYDINAKRSNLYWRITNENVFQGIILAKGAEEGVLLRTADKFNNRGTSNLIINQASDLLATSYSNVIKLDTGLFKQIKVRTIANIVKFLPIEITDELKTTVSSYSYISEPDEFIRLINLLKQQPYL